MRAILRFLTLPILLPLVLVALASITIYENLTKLINQKRQAKGWLGY